MSMMVADAQLPISGLLWRIFAARRPLGGREACIHYIIDFEFCCFLSLFVRKNEFSKAKTLKKCLLVQINFQPQKP